MTTSSKTKKASLNKPSSKSIKLSKITRRSRPTLLSAFVQGFLKRVLNTVTAYELWQKNDSFIVAVSGGPDSLCLLDVLYLLSKKYAFTLHVAHVNYHLRGTDSDLDEACVRERTHSYGLSLTVLSPKKTTGGNLEEKLRDIRYHFFEKLRAKKNASLIAVAHHEDDQAETFLLRLLRGSGLTGLSAMRPKHGYVIRPLIAMNRTDILRYLKERRLSYRTDHSNTDPHFFRNRLRNELLPLLEKKYQPRIRKILADTASLLAADYALFEEDFVLPATKTGTSICFSVKTLLALPEPLLRHQMRLLLRPFFCGKFPPKGAIEEVLKLLKSTKNKPQTYSFQGLKIERKGDTVRLLDFSE